MQVTHVPMLMERKEVELLVETRNLLDELIETMDIESDPEAMKKFKQAKKEVERGQISDFE